MRKAPLSRLFVIICALSTPAVAQSDPENPQPAPAAAPGAATPSPSGGWTAPPQPQPQQAPAQPNNAQPYPQQSMAPANGNAQPPTQSSPAYANASTRDANNNNQRNNDNGSRPFNGEEAQKPDSKFELPTMSVRIDPFNWLLAGRLGLELESQVWKFISVELVPIFVVNDQPPYLNLNLIGVPNTLHQSSAGVGAIAGTSVGVGFWLNNTPLEGYVLRAEITDYVINYDSRDANGPIDHVAYAEREFQVLFGSHSKWGPVTLAGTFGIGSALNRQQRCFTDFSRLSSVQTSGCPNNKQMMLAITPPNPNTGEPMAIVNLNGWLYPMDLIFRISLGVVF